MKAYDVIIVGGGAGGLVATAGCAQLGLKTLLIEKHRLGGDCLYHGCVPSKSLLKAATVYHHTVEGERFGLPKASVPAPDMAKVNGRVQKVIGAIAKHDSPQRFEEMGAEVIFGSPKFNSPSELQLQDGRIFSSKRIILSVGSAPRSVPVPGLEEAGYITNIHIFDLKTRPNRLAIIGGGPIGTEMSQVFTRLGAKVTLIDMAGHILIKDDADMVETLQNRLLKEGVHLRLNAKISRVEKKGDTKRVILAGDDGEEAIDVDEILVSAGRQANTSGLDLDKAGVVTERGFIKTDSTLRTSQKNILAIGDCNGQFLFTHVAAAEASVAVRRVALRIGGHINYRAVPWITYTDPEIASIGHNEGSAKQAGIAYSTIVQELRTTDRAIAEGEPDGRLKILIDRKGRVIGTQIVGYHAGELLLPALFSVTEGWKYGKLRTPMYPYPTIGEVYGKAIGGHLAPKLFNDRVRSILKFLHRYRGTAVRKSGFGGKNDE